MTPKEKAQGLVDNYFVLSDGILTYKQVKKCALIAVDEIINELTSIGILSGFWYEVNEEIEKL